MAPGAAAALNTHISKSEATMRFLLLLFLLAVGASGATAADFRITKGPADFRVYQRGPDGLAAITIEGESSVEGDVWACILKEGAPAPVKPWAKIGAVKSGRWSGTVGGVPTGGVYTLHVSCRDAQGQALAAVEVRNLLVGDLWVMAGQSNMEGAGVLEDVEQPHPLVNLLQSKREWSAAVEPLHWLWESPDEVHWLGLDQQKLAELRVGQRAGRTRGAGLGLPFAKRLVAETGVPIGLIATAHGGTTMNQWDPAKRSEGGKSLYGSMMLQVEAAGGRVAGVIWYQGEGDTEEEAVGLYRQRMKDLVAAMRRDMGREDLPFICVQIGRHIWPRDDKHAHWFAIQDLERVLAAEIPNTAVVASIDQPLDDLIHIGTPGLKVIGHRMANQALRIAHGRKEFAQGPLLKNLTINADANVVRVHFLGVNVSLSPARHIAGFSVLDESGNTVPVLFEVQVDPKRPDTVLVMLRDKVLPDGKWQLAYGWSADPYCNLVDANGEGCLVFGPQPLAGLPVE